MHNTKSTSKHVALICEKAIAQQQRQTTASLLVVVLFHGGPVLSYFRSGRLALHLDQVGLHIPGHVKLLEKEDQDGVPTLNRAHAQILVVVKLARLNEIHAFAIAYKQPRPPTVHRARSVVAS